MTSTFVEVYDGRSNDLDESDFVPVHRPGVKVCGLRESLVMEFSSGCSLNEVAGGRFA